MKAKKVCKKKAREAAEKLAKALDSESEAKEASEVNNNSMKAGFLEDLEKAK